MRFFLAILPTLALAQTFEVASIKPAIVIAEGARRNVVERQPAALTLRNATLSFCLQWAYDMKFYQVSGPAWLNQERYDILAKASAPTPPDQIRVMLQNLLADRFALTVHRETKSRPVYELVAAKGRHKLREATPADAGGISVANGNFVFRHTTLPALADQLSDFAGMDRPVIDKTGIRGAFDFTLSGLARRVAEGDALSIFEAVEQQLGLRLQPRQGPIEMLVIDRAQKIPSGN